MPSTKTTWLFMAAVIIIATSIPIAVWAQKQGILTPPYPVATEDQHWLTEDLPFSETPYEDAPVLNPAPGTPDPEVMKRAQEASSNAWTEPASGPETAGSYITANGKVFKLADDAYVAAFIVTIQCINPTDENGTSLVAPCPKTPYYVLQKFQSDAHVRVESNGTVATWDRTPQEALLDLATFQDVVEAFGGELRVEGTYTPGVAQDVTVLTTDVLTGTLP